MNRNRTMTTDAKPAGLTGKTLVMYMLVLGYGVSTTFIGTIILQLLDEFSVPIADGGIFYSVMNTGCFLGILASGHILDRFSLRSVITVTYTVFALLLVSVALTSTLGSFLCVTFVIGMSCKLFDAATNAYVSREYVHNKGFFMNLLHCSFGVGSFFGPLVAGMFVEHSRSWRTPYLFMGILCLLLFAAYRLLSRGDAIGSGESDAALPATFKSVMTRPMAFLLLTMFFYSGHQMGMNSWLPAYLGERFSIDTVSAGFGLSVFWLGLIFSRLSCSFLTKTINERTLLVYGFALGSLFMLVGIGLDSEMTTYIASAAAGLFTGATIPMLLTLGYIWYPHARGKVTMLLFISLTFGQIAFPWLMGRLGGSFGLKTSMLLNGALLAGALLFGLFLPKPVPEDAHSNA